MLNRVILVGKLSRDPELRFTPAGKAVCSFSLAVKRQFKNQNGEYETDFVNIVQWNGAENTANFLKKGSLAGVDGRVQTRSYEGQDGKRVYVTEVLAESVQFLEPNGSGEKKEQPAPRYTADPGDPFKDNGAIEITDDSLPF